MTKGMITTDAFARICPPRAFRPGCLMPKVYTDAIRKTWDSDKVNELIKAEELSLGYSSIRQQVGGTQPLTPAGFEDIKTLVREMCIPNAILMRELEATLKQIQDEK